MPDPLRSVAIVTAAGSAERFGGKKLLADVGGEPMLDRTIRCLLEGDVSEVIVVVGTDGRKALERDVNAMNDARVRPVENRQPERGMFSSIQEGVRTASGDVLLVLPGDMPFVRSDTVRTVIQQWTKTRGIVSPRYNGKRGHPVALPLGLRDEILATPATSNLHEVIKRHLDQRTDLDVDDPGIVKDVDTPADLEARP
ncbi:MAG: nucleotidyltransferase family protein [Chloroflexota bacterium]|nr:nucleotidyltransferase family protein [Chloroflexota bacterium]